jgi:enamine deaminase RidA (YjgF/YER057c/UK114 family)
MRRGTRFARVHGAILFDPPQLNAIRYAANPGACVRTRTVCVAIALLLLQGGASERAFAQASEDPEGRLRALGLTLPSSNVPAGNYVSAVRTGNLLYLATHGECGTPLRGKVGAGVSVDSAYASARRVALCMLGTLKTELGDLRRVVRIVRVTGMVNSAPDFTDQPKVINGCSDLLVAVFGDKGRHARGVLGVASMADGRTVGIEMIVEVRD